MPGMQGASPALYPRCRSLTRRHSQIERIHPSLAFSVVKLGLGVGQRPKSPVRGNLMLAVPARLLLISGD